MRTGALASILGREVALLNVVRIHPVPTNNYWDVGKLVTPLGFEPSASDALQVRLLPSQPIGTSCPSDHKYVCTIQEIIKCQK